MKDHKFEENLKSIVHRKDIGAFRKSLNSLSDCNAYIVDREEDECKLTTLHFLAIIGKNDFALKCLDMLLSKPSVDINIRGQANDVFGMTPAHFAVLHHNVEILKFLIKKGCDLFCCDSNGKNIIDYAASNKSKYPDLHQIINDAVLCWYEKTFLSNTSDDQESEKVIDQPVSSIQMDLQRMRFLSESSVQTDSTLNAFQVEKEEEIQLSSSAPVSAPINNDQPTEKKKQSNNARAFWVEKVHAEQETQQAKSPKPQSLTAKISRFSDFHANREKIKKFFAVDSVVSHTPAKNQWKDSKDKNNNNPNNNNINSNHINKPILKKQQNNNPKLNNVVGIPGSIPPPPPPPPTFLATNKSVAKPLAQSNRGFSLMKAVLSQETPKKNWMTSSDVFMTPSSSKSENWGTPKDNFSVTSFIVEENIKSQEEDHSHPATGCRRKLHY